jgi:hypothetical protein
MSVVAKTQAALAALPLFSAGQELLAAADGDLEVRCELVALDSLACAFERLSLLTPALASSPVDKLKTVAEKISARLTYLLEPISPIEIDAERCVVQLRSSPPQKDQDRTSYYELLVERGQISLVRYARTAGTSRQVIAAQVTREVLIRLVSDFVAVAG